MAEAIPKGKKTDTKDVMEGLNNMTLDDAPVGQQTEDFKATATGNKVTHPATDIRECLLSTLDWEQVEELATLLDVNNKGLTKNWLHLAIELGFDEAERNAMQRDGKGGGHPASDFLMHLKSSNVDANAEDLIQKCKRMKRNDIVKSIEDEIRLMKLTLQTKICDFPDDFTEFLAEKLTCSGGVIKDWKTLASYYGYDSSEIQNIGSRMAVNAHFSPTKALFEMLNASKPKMKIAELIEILKKMNRYDVVRKIESFS